MVCQCYLLYHHLHYHHFSFFLFYLLHFYNFTLSSTSYLHPSPSVRHYAHFLLLVQFTLVELTATHRGSPVCARSWASLIDRLLFVIESPPAKVHRLRLVFVLLHGLVSHHRTWSTTRCQSRHRRYYYSYSSTRSVLNFYCFVL